MMILLNNVCCKQTAERLAFRLGKLFHNSYQGYEVKLCPAGGSIDVWVESNYYDNETEMKEDILSRLTYSLLD